MVDVNELAYASMAASSLALGPSGLPLRSAVYSDWTSVVLMVEKCVERISSIDEIVVGAEEMIASTSATVDLRIFLIDVDMVVAVRAVVGRS